MAGVAFMGHHRVDALIVKGLVLLFPEDLFLLIVLQVVDALLDVGALLHQQPCQGLGLDPLEVLVLSLGDRLVADHLNVLGSEPRVQCRLDSGVFRVLGRLLVHELWRQGGELRIMGEKRYVGLA